MIVVNFIGTVLFYIFIVTSFIIATPIFFLTWLFSRPFDPLHRIPHTLNAYTAKFIVKINPYWNLSVNGVENIDLSKTYVIAANHQSLVDILILYHLYPLQFKFVAKRELTYIPFIGWCMYLAKYVLLDRKNPKSQFLMMRNSEHYLDKGMSIGIFPEGTRSKSGELKRFKNGASLLAKTTSAEILPVCIIGNNRAMPEKGFIWRGVTDIKVNILEPFKVDGLETKEITAKTYDSINTVISI